MKIKILIPALLLLSGCASFPERGINTQIIKINTPVLYSPPPPEFDRPDLIIHELTEAQKRDPGQVVKYYRATVIQLLGYVEQLETVVESYDTVSDTLQESATTIKNGIDVDILTD